MEGGNVRMSSVDERVVHLQFDNAQFEKGVKTSLSSIQKLKNGLNFKGAADNMKNFQKQIVTPVYFWIRSQVLFLIR